MDALAIDKAHLVGGSYAGAVALQAAASHPVRVHTLTLIEPPPVHTSFRAEFADACDQMLETRRESGPEVAIDQFLTTAMSSEWQAEAEASLTGATTQMRRDALTFFDTDLPALLSWEFGPDSAATITCPVLHVGGSASGPWFAAVRALMLAWFPRAADVVVEGADHGLPLTHAGEAAVALAEFLRAHSS